jgi:hypothetical protein
MTEPPRRLLGASTRCPAATSSVMPTALAPFPAVPPGALPLRRSGATVCAVPPRETAPEDWRPSLLAAHIARLSNETKSRTWAVCLWCPPSGLKRKLRRPAFKFGHVAQEKAPPKRGSHWIEGTGTWCRPHRSGPGRGRLRGGDNGWRGCWESAGSASSSASTPTRTARCSSCTRAAWASKASCRSG